MSDTRLILFVSLIVTLLFVTAMVALTFTSAGRSSGSVGSVQNPSIVIDRSVTETPTQSSLTTNSSSYRAKEQNEFAVAQNRQRVVDSEPGPEFSVSEISETDQVDEQQYASNLRNEPQESTQVDQQDDQDTALDQSGDQTLGGRVINQAGRAIAGVTVFVRLKGATEKEAVSLTTNRSGRFTVNSLRKGDYLIQTQATTIYPSVTTSAQSGVTTVTLTLTANSQFSIRGLVRDTTDQPLAGVAVSTPDGRTEVTTNRQGQYSATLTAEPNQPVVLTFSATGFVENSQSIQPRNNDATGSMRLDVTMQGLGNIILSGQVTDEQLNPIDKAGIVVTSAQHGLNLFVESNEQGEYSVDGLLHASDYQIQVSKMPAFESWNRSDYEISGSTQLDVPLNTRPTGRIWGYLMNLDGQPILNKTFTAIGADFARSIRSGADDGFYEFHTVTDRVSFTYGNSVPKVEMRGPAVVEGDDIQLDLKLNTGDNNISGKVVSDQGVAVPAATVDLVWQGTFGALYSKVQFRDQTDDKGAFSFSGLGRGKWALTVTASGYGGSIIPGVDPVVDSPLSPITLTRQ